MNDIRIKISAIAKDEAAYLPEWIFHHLHFGFDHIEIMINRTSDNSKSLLRQIQETCNVSFIDYDWLDLCPDTAQKSIQYIAYADAYNRACAEGYTHILFIDIDEFWTPRDFTTTIKEFISRSDDNASISFYWYCELGTTDAFSPINESLKYFPNEHVKTLINLSSPIAKIKIHAPLFKPGANHRLADGSAFVARDAEGQFNKEQLFKDPLLPAFIIHRMYRSEQEYISSLFRGNPNSNENIGTLFKDNRHGFKTTSATQSTLEFSSDAYKVYIAKLQSFYLETGIQGLISCSRDYVRGRAHQALSAAAELFIVDTERAKKLFAGCNDPKLRALHASKPGLVKYKVDTISESDNFLKVVGWAVSGHPNLPVTFTFDQQAKGFSIELIERPDVSSIFTDASPKSGFKVTLDRSNLETDAPNPNFLIIGLPAAVQTSHASSLYFNPSTSKIEHILEEDIVNSIGKLPVYLTQLFDKEVLAVYYKNTVKIIIKDDSNQIALVAKETATSEQQAIYKFTLPEYKFGLRLDGRFLSAVKDGPIAFDRTETKGWETFHESELVAEKVSLDAKIARLT